MRVVMLFLLGVGLIAVPNRDLLADPDVDTEAVRMLDLAFADHPGIRAAKYKFRVRETDGTAWAIACNSIQLQADDRVKVTRFYAVHLRSGGGGQADHPTGMQLDGSEKGYAIIKPARPIRQPADLNRVGGSLVEFGGGVIGGGLRPTGAKHP